jgi:RNA polymerase sigma-70 factor (ECF subfamily)
VTVSEAHARSWEDELHIRLTAGDETALGDLYDQFAAYVYGLALRVTASEAAAEDVTQEVFVGMWERPGMFDPARGSMRSFLGTLAHRRAVDWVRREAAERRRRERDSHRDLLPPDVGELASALVLAEELRAAVEELPPEQRVAVRLAYFGGRTYRQVAEELGLPEGTVKARLRSALRRLAHALDPEGVEQWA